MAGVYKSGQSVALYINGVKVAEDTTNVPSAIGLTGQPIRIGARADYSSQGQWDGQIDEVRLFNRALSQAEIQDLMNNPAPVTSYYHFGGERVAMRQANGVYYLHADHLGTASLTTQSNGSVQHQVRHYPFGGERWSSGGDVNPYGYTDQRPENFGTIEYGGGTRHLDPLIGRFLSPDSVVPDFANPQDLNRYSYVRNNPVRFTDPTGHYTFEDEPDDPFVWHRDKVMPELVRASQPIFIGDKTQDMGYISNIPTVIGRKVDVSLGVDAFVGNEINVGGMIAFNWYSGELSFMPNVAWRVSGGTPGLASISASDKLFLATGATSNDMIAGPANVFSGEFGADAVVKVGLAGERGSSVRNYWNGNPLDTDWGPNADQLIIPAIDPISGMPVTFGSIGVNFGVNATPNIIEARGGWSPGTNYTWNLLLRDFY